MGYYLSLKDPEELRKSFLETAKDSVELLKSQYALKEIRVKKKDYLIQLGDVVGEIHVMIERLEELTPEHEVGKMPSAARNVRSKNQAKKHKVRKKVDKESKHEVKKSKKSKKTKKKTKKKSRRAKSKSSKKPKTSPEEERAKKALEQLEGKLTSIESKLNKL